MSISAAEEFAAIYAAIIDSALDSVIVVDEDGRVVALNPAAVATFGYTVQEAIGQEIGALIVPDSLRERHQAGMKRYRATNEAHVLGRRVEMEACHRNGQPIPVELAITEVHLPAGRYFTANLRDLRPVRAARQEIERQRNALHQSEKLAAIGSLLAGLAHELNNPLSIALGESELLVCDVEERSDPSVFLERALRIHDAADRCAKVVRSFLSIVRHRPPLHRPTDMRNLIGAAINLLRHPLRTANVTVKVELPDDLPDVLADPDQVQQIVVNLIVNATQALDASVLPRRLVISGDASAGMCRLRFRDTGPGVPPDLAERIFEPFFSTKTEGVGTGVGLAVSRRLAEAQGGTLRLVQHGGAGADFELALPLAPATPLPEQQTAGAVRPLRLLIVDDEALLADVLAEGLRRAGHDCTTATGGRRAMAILETDRFDAVICDLRMPDIDGPTLHQWMKRTHPEMAAATVFMTGDALGQVAAQVVAVTGQPLLEKPVAASDLEQVLARLAETPRHN